MPVRRNSMYSGPEVGKNLRAQRVERRPPRLELRKRGQKDCVLKLRSRQEPDRTRLLEV